MGAQRTVIDPTMPNPWHQTGTQPDHPPGGSKRPDRALAELAQSLSKLANTFGGDARFSVRVQPNGVVLTLSDAVLFGPGDARLRRQALPILDAIARMLLQNPHAVVVEGHTDDRPGVMPTANWRLSTDRAINVLSYFVEEHGYPPSRLAAAGYGQYHPIGDNQDEEGRARNRRVELVILQDSKVPPEYQR
jgi:chemotaxis protein MotB